MGISVVEIILKAASQRARQFGDEGRHAYIQGLDWIQCPESIRLRYFSQLAIQVRDGKIENALKHFDNPKDCIINWFHDEIENGDIEELVATAHQRFLEECAVLYKSLSRVSNVQELIHLLNDYDYNIAAYSSVSSILQNCRSFLDLKAAILSGFVEKQSVFLDSIKLKSYLASDRPQLMNRLGCLASCPWCGAICWGYKGHEASIQGIGSLGKHHTCHQPQGLAGICYESTGELVFETCESNNKGVVRPDDGNQVVPDFVDRTESFWIFDGGKHPRNEFADLMTWFFLKMHPALAKHHGVGAANFSGNGDLHDLDNRLDSILLWARNGIMM